MTICNIFLIGGTGRLGSLLTKGLTSAGFSVALSSRNNKVPCVFPVEKADVVFVCVPDDCLESVTNTYASCFTKFQVVAHCSGAHTLSVLSPAAERGAHIGSLHPLQAISSACTNLPGSFAAIDGDAVAIDRLTIIAQTMGWSPLSIYSNSRGLYHCAASMASNGLVGLAKQSVDLLDKCGIAPEQALEALIPLMQSTLQGLKEHGLPKALTGPVARGDVSTISRHLEALSEHAPNTLSLYRHLAAVLFRLAAPQLSNEVNKQIQKLLEEDKL